MNQEERDFLAEIDALIIPIITAAPEYRLYYNELGEIISGSMIEHPESGQYIIVTEEEYHNYFSYRVVDQKIQLIEKNTESQAKLKKSTAGYAVVKNQASLVIEPGEEYQDIEYYKRNDTIN